LRTDDSLRIIRLPPRVLVVTWAVDRAKRLKSRINVAGKGRRVGLVATHRRIIAATSGSILSNRLNAEIISARTFRKARRPQMAAVPYERPAYSSNVGPMHPHHSSSSVTPHEYLRRGVMDVGGRIVVRWATMQRDDDRGQYAAQKETTKRARQGDSPRQ
jgi:hypothetical protein